MEQWKFIDGFGKKYQISNKGNVKSTNFNGTGKAKMLKPRVNTRGYYVVHLYGDGYEKFCTIHRLVAKHFIDNPKNEKVVNHKDENKLNNNVENLEWCSYKYNSRYSCKLHPEREHGRKIDNSRRERLKKRLKQVDKNGNTIAIYKDINSYCKETNRSRWSISQCCDGKRKTAYGYKWEFC